MKINFENIFENDYLSSQAKEHKVKLNLGNKNQGSEISPVTYPLSLCLLPYHACPLNGCLSNRWLVQGPPRIVRVPLLSDGQE